MPLIVPATGGFSIGSNLPSNEPKTVMNMSLDDVIKNRRQETVKQSRRGGGGVRATTADRSIAAGRVKRQAAMNARRNLTPTKKASNMDIDREVKAQTARTQKAKDRQEQKKVGGGRVAAAGGAARRGRAAKKAAVPIKQTNTKQASAQVAGAGQAPSKKAVNAAVQAFKANGFQIPQGTQMVIRFETPQAATTPKQQPQGGGGGGAGKQAGRGAGGRGGGGRGGDASRSRGRRGGGGGAGRGKK